MDANPLLPVLSPVVFHHFYLHYFQLFYNHESAPQLTDPPTRDAVKFMWHYGDNVLGIRINYPIHSGYRWDILYEFL